MKHLFLLTGMLLAACSQNPDGTTALGAKGSPAWFATATPDVIAAHYRAACEAYGYQAGTYEMTRCIERNADNGRTHGQQAAAQISEAFSRASRAQRLHCSSYTYGGGAYTNTNCY